jgi:hypothetical protein
MPANGRGPNAFAKNLVNQGEWSRRLKIFPPPRGKKR